MRTVSARLGLVVGMCVLTVVLVVAGMAHRAGKIDAQIRGILEDSTIARDVRDMRTATAHNVATAIQLITTQEASLRAGIAKRNVETARGIDSTLARLDAGLAGDDEHRLYREAQLLQEEIRRVRAELLLAEPGLQDVSEEIEKQLVPIVARYLAATGALTDLVDARLAAGVQARVAELDREALTMSAISVVAMLVFAALALRITRGIVARIRDATAAADAVATGDLSRPISAGGSDEIGQLLAALLRMQEGLRSIVTDVRRGASSVRQAAEAIAARNSELDADTALQARSAANAAADVDRLAASITGAARRAHEVDRFVAVARDLAHESGAGVQKMVTTMALIADAGRKIGDITAMIESIAFQTNILALNAAVEAARAGEQGRGFAVVASAVRNLSSRTSAAAQNVRSLVEGAMNQIAQGSSAVESAGSSVGETVSRVEQATELLGQMREVASEQSAHAGAVRATVAQIDASARDNAERVRSMRDGAEQLRELAVSMNAGVEAFKLG